MNRADLPSIFVRLFDEGRFDYWGAPYASLTQAQREERGEANRTRVLWLKSIEWDRTPDDIVVADGSDGKLRPGLITFAGNGHGDRYCWHPRWQGAALEAPILFVPHDELNATLFARSFGECLLRCLLGDHANWDTEYDGDEEERSELWVARASIVMPLVDEAARRQLAALGDSPSSKECKLAQQVVAKQVGHRAVTGIMLSTRYDEEVLRGADLIRAYTASEQFYRELVEGEGLEPFRGKLEEVSRRLAEIQSARQR